MPVTTYRSYDVPNVGQVNWDGLFYNNFAQEIDADVNALYAGKITLQADAPGVGGSVVQTGHTNISGYYGGQAVALMRANVDRGYLGTVVNAGDFTAGSSIDDVVLRADNGRILITVDAGATTHYAMDAAKLYPVGSLTYDLGGSSNRWNTVYAGTALVSAARSPNYVALTSGWSIDANAYAEFQDIRARGIFESAVFGVGHVTAIGGSQLVSKSASVISPGQSLTTPGSITPGVTTTSTTVDASAAGVALFAVNDAVEIRAIVGGVAKALNGVVTTAGGVASGVQSITITLQTGTNVSVVFPAGTAIVNLGPTGSSYISLSADGAFGGATANVSLWGHSGQPWTDSVRTVAIPADGQVRVGSNVAAAATTSFATFPANPAGGYNGETMVAGSVLIGDNTAGGSPKANVYWDPTANQLKFRQGTTVQAYIDTDGKIKAGAGKVTLDTGGITIRSDGSSLVAWKSSGGTTHGGISVNHDITGITTTSLPISSINPTSSGQATISMQAKPVSDNLTFGLIAIDSGNAYGYLSYSGVGTFNGLFVGVSGVPSAALQVRKATEQLRLDYDASNYAKVTVASSGATTIATVGSTAANAHLILAPASGNVQVDQNLATYAVRNSGTAWGRFAGYISNTSYWTENIRWDGANWYSDDTGAASLAAAMGVAGITFYSFSAGAGARSPTAFAQLHNTGLTLGSGSAPTSGYVLQVEGNVYIPTSGKYLNFAGTSYGAPTTGSRSTGTKIVLFDIVGGSNADYAIGIQDAHIWYSTQQMQPGGGTTTSGHIFYAGQTELGRFTSWGATGAGVYFPASGAAAPSTSASGVHSAGTKIVLWPAVDGSNVDYAIGIEANTAWFSIPSTSQSFKWYIGTTAKVRLTGGGSFVVGSAALATNATDGFLYIPSCAGTPSGTPTTQTGTIPLVYDSTNHILYAYSGGSWRAH